jgi:hypothetical protein
VSVDIIRLKRHPDSVYNAHFLFLDVTTSSLMILLNVSIFVKFENAFVYVILFKFIVGPRSFDGKLL